MRSLASCSTLALGVLFACAQQHEGAVQRDPTQTGASNEAESGEGSEGDDDTSASSASAMPAQDAAQPWPAAVGSGPLPRPFPAPPTIPGPSLFPIPPTTAPPPPINTPQICEKRSFDSLAPPEHIRVTQPCTYWVVSWPLVREPKYLRVTIDGRTVPLGVADFGWMVAEENNGVTLLGAACEAAQTGAAITITSECILPILN